MERKKKKKSPPVKYVLLAIKVSFPSFTRRPSFLHIHTRLTSPLRLLLVPFSLLVSLLFHYCTRRSSFEHYRPPQALGQAIVPRPPKSQAFLVALQNLSSLVEVNLTSREVYSLSTSRLVPVSKPNRHTLPHRHLEDETANLPSSA